MNTEFKREDRYLTLKRTDIKEALTDSEIRQLIYLADKVSLWRDWNGKPEFCAVLIESDWPEYEPVWAMLEARLTGKSPEKG
jgi:hypothetical protein